MRLTSRVALLAIATSLAAGCGAAAEPELTQDERMDVATANLAAARNAVDGSEYGATLEGVDRMIELYRAKADAMYEERTMRQVLQDLGSTLEPYEPELASQIDRALGESD